MFGHDTIAGAVADSTIARFVRGLVDDTLEAAEFPAALERGRIRRRGSARFANPALGHRCAQVGADGSSKLPQRLLPIVAARRKRGLPTRRFAVVAAIWIAAAAGVTARGVRLPQLEDPIAAALRAASRRENLQELSHRALGSPADAGFTAEVASLLGRLTAEGPALIETQR